MSPHEFAQLRRKKRTLSYLLEAIIKPNPYNKLTIDDIIVPSVVKLKA